MELVGDEAKWDAIFASREAELVASGFQWPEGPRWTKSKGLLFSDTISGKMYRWDEATKSAVVFLDDAGGCPKANLVEGYECAAGQAEPGPNGLSREYPGDQLVVSDCCQGATPTCPAGEARWNVYDLSRDLWRATFVRRIEHADDVKEGCADGFVYHAWFHVLLASCPGGLCVVGLDEGAVIAKLRFGGSVANVELGGGYAWITGNGGLYRIKLNDEARGRRSPSRRASRAGPRRARTSARRRRRL
ncbi:hypothetical protein JL720_11937 [Aureococcus anophagefferens]|nr:hypothetical protein JL720_11937 [Aureococcus anophagefferens]